MRKLSLVGAVTVALLALLPGTATAQYLDPGTGSVLLQGLLALIGATVVTAGIYWRATRDLIRRLLRRKTGSKPDRPGDV